MLPGADMTRRWTIRLLWRYYLPIMASERVQRQIDRLLDEAEEAISREDWSTVGSRVRSVLAIDPENSDAKAYSSAAQRALGTRPESSTPQPQAAPPSSPAAAPCFVPNA